MRNAFSENISPRRESVDILISLQESHKRSKKEKKESLDEDQLFVAELAQDLGRVCQVTSLFISHYELQPIIVTFVIVLRS